MQRGYGNLSETVHIALSLGGKQNSVFLNLPSGGAVLWTGMELVSVSFTISTLVAIKHFEKKEKHNV